MSAENLTWTYWTDNNSAFVICQHCKIKYPEDDSKWKIKSSGISTSNIIWHLKSAHKVL